MKSPGLVIVFIVVLAVIAGGTWQFEVGRALSSYDDSWLQYQHWSPFVAIGCISLAYLLPVYAALRPPLKELAAAIIEVYLTLLVAYFISRAILLSLYTGFTGQLGPVALWLLLGVILLMSCYNLFLTSRRRLFNIDVRHVWIFALGLVLPLLLSWPVAHLLFGATLMIEVLRTAAPFSLLTLSLGLMSYYLSIKRLRPLLSGREDILDEAPYRPKEAK